MKQVKIGFALSLTLLTVMWGSRQVGGQLNSAAAPWVGAQVVAEMPAQPAHFQPAAPTSAGPIYGVNFMSSAEDPADAQQYANALSTGATWNQIGKEDYLIAMQRSPVKDIELKHLLKNALTSQIHDREVYLKGIDVSYYYEGYTTFKTEEL